MESMICLSIFRLFMCVCNNGIRERCVCVALVATDTQEPDLDTQEVCVSSSISPGCISKVCHLHILPC